MGTKCSFGALVFVSAVSEKGWTNVTALRFKSRWMFLNVILVYGTVTQSHRDGVWIWMGKNGDKKKTHTRKQRQLSLTGSVLIRNTGRFKTAKAELV